MKVILFFALALMCSIRVNAQISYWETFWTENPWLFDNDFDAQDDYLVYSLTPEREAELSKVEGSQQTIIEGSFFSNLFEHCKYYKSSTWCDHFAGIPCAIDAHEGDVIIMTFDFENAENLDEVRTTYKNPWTKKIRKPLSRAAILPKYKTLVNVYTEIDSIGAWEDEYYYDPTYNSVAVRQHENGMAYPILHSRYIKIDSTDVNPNYKIIVRKYGKIASIKFDVAPQATFDITDRDGMLIYNLLHYVSVSAVDTYGNVVPILNSLVTQWQVDKESGIARFTPILYPFSCTIDGLDDSYETDATNKSASTEEDDNVPNAGTTLDNCMTLEAVNPNMLLLDLNKGGTVTDIATINANATAQNVWYDMFGRKYTTKPTAAGLYIHNGKKEVVK